MRDCRFHNKGRCDNPNHCNTFCHYEDANDRYRCWDYEGKNE